MYAKKLFLGKLYLFSFVNLQTVKDGLHKQLVEFYEKEEGEERSEVSNNDAQIATNAEEEEEKEEEEEGVYGGDARDLPSCNLVPAEAI